MHFCLNNTREIICFSGTKFRKLVPEETHSEEEAVPQPPCRWVIQIKYRYRLGGVLVIPDSEVLLDKCLILTFSVLGPPEKKVKADPTPKQPDLSVREVGRSSTGTISKVVLWNLLNNKQMIFLLSLLTGVYCYHFLWILQGLIGLILIKILNFEKEEENSRF